MTFLYTLYNPKKIRSYHDIPVVSMPEAHMLTTNLTFKSILNELIQVYCILYFDNDIEDIIFISLMDLLLLRNKFFFSVDKIS